MKLNVPLVKQRSSFSCGIISTYMVMKYKGYNIELEKLFKNIPYSRKGTTSFEIVHGLRKLGIEAYSIIWAPWLFKSFSVSEIKRKISQVKDRKLKSVLRKFLRVYEYTKIEPIDESLLKKLIKEKIPPIVFINAPVFREKMYGKWRGHFVVVVGYGKSHFLVNDPHPILGGLLQVKHDTFIASIYAAQYVPSIVVIR